jgi:hypothetical protein
MAARVPRDGEASVSVLKAKCDVIEVTETGDTHRRYRPGRVRYTAFGIRIPGWLYLMLCRLIWAIS